MVLAIRTIPLIIPIQLLRILSAFKTVVDIQLILKSCGLNYLLVFNDAI